ncbi:hypothetical protein [Rhodococcus jostii]|uniref:hypothetical protein n=1 Tax=Rhodococcus jostii TaxID=132919 RepID=UPI003642A884
MDPHLFGICVAEVNGVNDTGLAFNSVVALELNDGSPIHRTRSRCHATIAIIPASPASELPQRRSPRPVHRTEETGLLLLGVSGRSIGGRRYWY